MGFVFFNVIFLLCGSKAFGIDLNSLIPRTNCYSQEQDGCNQEFTEAYPELSLSVTNLTKADTYFYLFTRKNQDKPENLHKCGGHLPPNTNYNPDNRLIVIFNPFLAGMCDIAVFREWTAQILLREDANVLLVDSSWGNYVDYATAVMNAKIVAKQTVVVLQNIKEDRGLANSRVYLVGLSLGAQIAGMVGNVFGVGRITGLDPAGPGFDKSKTPPEDRLDPSDADLVDVWHTNMGDCLPKLGIDYDAGHVDFYINGGKRQDACHKYGFISVLKGDIRYGFTTLLLSDTCSHAFSTQYFKVSINPGKCQFVGVKCRNVQTYKSSLYNFCGRSGKRCAIMGFDLDKYFVKSSRFPQRYYVETGTDCPYCESGKVRLQGFTDTYTKLLQ